MIAVRKFTAGNILIPNDTPLQLAKQLNLKGKLKGIESNHIFVLETGNHKRRMLFMFASGEKLDCS